MAAAISGRGFWCGQCFRGIVAQTWRANDHGRRRGRSWLAAIGDLQLAGSGAAEAGDRRGRYKAGGIGRAAFGGASPNWRGGRRYALAVWRAISEKAGGRGETSPKFEAGRQTPMIFAGWEARFIDARWTGRGAVWAQSLELLWGKARRAWPGWLFCRQPLRSSRSGGPNRTEKLSGGGGLGARAAVRAHFRHKGRTCLGRPGVARPKLQWGRAFGGGGAFKKQQLRVGFPRWG
jgi:hypothetical protein